MHCNGLLCKIKQQKNIRYSESEYAHAHAAIAFEKCFRMNYGVFYRNIMHRVIISLTNISDAFALSAKAKQQQQRWRRKKCTFSSCSVLFHFPSVHSWNTMEHHRLEYNCLFCVNVFFLLFILIVVITRQLERLFSFCVKNLTSPKLDAIIKRKQKITRRNNTNFSQIQILKCFWLWSICPTSIYSIFIIISVCLESSQWFHTKIKLIVFYS